MIKKIPSHWLALLDQFFVSGSNFLFAIILARTFGLKVYGLYVIATMYLMYANTFQSSMVVSPMMTAVPHEANFNRRQELVSGFFCNALILSFICAVGTIFIAHFVGLAVPSLNLGNITIPLFFAIIGFQVQDWLRRALYALHKIEYVVLLDILAYGGHLTILMVFSFHEKLTPELALLSVVATFSFASITVLTKLSIKPSYEQALLIAKQYWRGSRDFFISWQLQWIGTEGLILISGGFLGNEVVGAVRAAQNLAAPLNVVFQWMENVLPSRAVAHLKSNGLYAMHQFLGKVGMIGGLVFGVLVIILYFFSEKLIAMLYGDEYRQYAFFVVLQGLYLWQGHFYRLELYACRATENTAQIARASLIVAVFSIGFGLIAINLIEGLGVLLALILGQTVSYLYLWYCRKRFK